MAYRGPSELRNENKGRPSGRLLFFLFLAVLLLPAPALAFRAIPDEVKRGMDLVFERRYREAAEVLSAAVERYPDSPEGHYYLGLTHYSVERPREAAAEWEKTLQLVPRYPRTRLNLALAYFDTGDALLAEKNALLAVKEEPRSSLAHLILGRSFRQQKKFEEALPEYLRARDLAKKDAQVRAELGELYQDLGKDAESLAEYETAASLDPDNHYLRFLLGLAYLQKDDLARAEKEFTEAIRLDTEDAASYYNLGLVHLKRGDPAGVTSMVEALRIRNPAWSEELENALALQGKGLPASAATETVPYSPSIVRDFTFRSLFTRKGRLSFLSLDTNAEEKHESLLSQEVVWQVAGTDALGGYLVVCRQEKASSTVDGKAIEDPLLADINGYAISLRLDADGRVLSAAREGSSLPPQALMHLKRLWAGAFLAYAAGQLAPGDSWGTAREVEVPFAGWRILPASFQVESFEACGAYRCARLALAVYPSLEGIPETLRASFGLMNPPPALDESPAKDLRGEGTCYLNPQGGWMSSSRLLMTGSLVVQVEGKNAQVQFSVQENQNNR